MSYIPFQPDRAAESTKNRHKEISHVVAEDVFIAELMVESNVTLEANFLQAVLNKTVLQVTAGGGPHNVTLLQNDLVAGIMPVYFLFSKRFCFNTGWGK